MKMYLYFIIALVISAVIVDASLQDVCKQALAIEKDASFVNFCITSLQVDPKSQTSDIKGLALISSNLAKTNLTHNQARVKKFLNNGRVPENSKKALRDCQEVYDDSVDNVNEAINALNTNDKGTAQTMLSSLLTNIDTCLTSLKEVKATPLMDKENSDADRICTVALAITNLI